MIVPMKKTAVIVQSKDAEDSMEKLRALGALHVEHQIPPKGADINSIRDDIALVTSAINILSNPEFDSKSAAAAAKELKDWKAASIHLIDLWKRHDQLVEYSNGLKARIQDWERWGDFDPQKIHALAGQTIYIRLYEIPAKELSGLPEGVVVQKIFTAKGIVGCALISREKVAIPFKEVQLPKMSLAAMRSRTIESTKTIADIRNNIIQCLGYKNSFSKIRNELEKGLEFHEALRGMGQADTLSYLVGYVPQDTINSLKETSNRERWGLSISDPLEEDEVPTLIRNPRWVSIIEPVFKFLEIVPGYRELDISPLFLLFLSLFFGMIIGDAGYGLLYIALTAFAQKKMGKKSKDSKVFFLLYLFSASAVM